MLPDIVIGSLMDKCRVGGIGFAKINNVVEITILECALFLAKRK